MKVEKMDLVFKLLM